MQELLLKTRKSDNRQRELAYSNLAETNLFGLPLVNAGRADALDWLCARVAEDVPTRVAFLNAHCINVSVRDADYRSALNTAEAVLPDGSGVAAALRLRGEVMMANLNGTDLIPALCTRLAASGHSVFLLGGRPGVAERAAAMLQDHAPGLIVAGTQHGYFSGNEEKFVIRSINASGASVLLVAMGVPQQDIWLERHSAQLQPALKFGVGGLFDFLSGRIPRAPVVLRKTGLEWTYRLYQEPARMWRRYLVGNPQFLARAVVHALPTRETVIKAADDAAKRAMDATLAAAGLVILAPVFALIAAAIKLDSKGPALLRQTRIGQDGAPFTCLKFRSMFNDAEARRAILIADNVHGADGVTFKMRNDPRVTRVGKLLRRSSLDELPQLFNVLDGTMSLVGPRPPLPAEVARYTPHQRRRLAAKPGITCLWQISGRANLPFVRQVELDLQYIAERSCLTDLAILVKTVPAVLLARGAY